MELRTEPCGVHNANGRKHAIVFKSIEWMIPTELSSLLLAAQKTTVANLCLDSVASLWSLVFILWTFGFPWKSVSKYWRIYTEKMHEIRCVFSCLEEPSKYKLIWMYSGWRHVITWITGVKTIKRQTGLRMAVRHRSMSAGADLAYSLYRLYARSVCDVQRRCICGTRLVALYKCDAYSFTFTATSELIKVTIFLLVYFHLTDFSLLSMGNCSCHHSLSCG